MTTGDSGSWVFDAWSAIEPGPEEGTWQTELREEWAIVNGLLNGGYLLVVMARAALAADGDPDRHVVAATATYVSPPTMGEATVHAEVLRRGRSASQVRARLVQGGQVACEAAFTVAPLDAAPAVWGGVPPVEMPDEEACRDALGALRSVFDGGDPPMVKILSRTFDPATLGFLRGEPSGTGELRSWLRFVDDRPIDPLSLLLIADSLPPATLEVALTGWVPTLSMTVYVRAVPAPGPVRLRFRAGTIAGGRVDETLEVWDSADRLVAQSTQLAGIRLP